MNENTTPTPPVPDPDERPTEVLADASAQPAAEQPAPAPTPEPAAAGASSTPPGSPGTWGSPPQGAPGYGPSYGQGAQAGPGYPPPGAYPPPGGYPPPGAYPPPAATAPPASYPPVRRLTRSRTDRVIGGVCGGLARYWNTDPTLLRILTVVLTLATGGAFLVGYIIAWIAIPDEPAAPYPFGPSPRADQVGYAAGGNPPYADRSTAYEAPPRERSYLGWLVVSGVVLVAGILGLIGFFVSPSVQFWAILFAVILTLLGIGLMVGTRYGRARWLVILAVPMAFLTLGTVAAANWIDGEPNWGRWSSSSGALTVGDRTWAVEPADLTGSTLDYRLSAGDATLDLTGLTATTSGAQDRQLVSIDVGVGLGQLVVLVPADMTLRIDASVRAGQITVPGRDRVEGTNVTLATTIEPLAADASGYLVTLDAVIGAGNLEVRRAAA